MYLSHNLFSLPDFINSGSPLLSLMKTIALLAMHFSLIILLPPHTEVCYLSVKHLKNIKRVQEITLVASLISLSVQNA